MVSAEERRATLMAHGWYVLETNVSYKRATTLAAARQLLEALGGVEVDERALRVVDSPSSHATSMRVRFDLSRAGVPAPTMALFRLLTLSDARLLGASSTTKAARRKRKKKKMRKAKQLDLSKRISKANEAAALRLLLQAVKSVAPAGAGVALEDEIRALPATRAAVRSAAVTAAAAVAAGEESGEEVSSSPHHAELGAARRTELMAEFRIFRKQLLRDTSVQAEKQLSLLL